MATNLIYFTGPVRKQTASEEVTMGTEVLSMRIGNEDEMPCPRTQLSWRAELNREPLSYENIVSWEPEGCRCCAKMFHWKPEGRYRCTKSVVIAPFWFSTEHSWTALTPIWLSADDTVISTEPWQLFKQCCVRVHPVRVQVTALWFQVRVTALRVRVREYKSQTFNSESESKIQSKTN